MENILKGEESKALNFFLEDYHKGEKRTKKQFIDKLYQESIIAHIIQSRLTDEGDAEFFTFPEVQLMRIEAAIFYYITDVLDVWDLIFDLDEEEQHKYTFPPLLDKSTASFFNGYAENQYNVEFMDAEYEKANNLIYYLRQHYPNDLPKSKEEWYDRYLDAILACRAHEEQNNPKEQSK
jgi:hypothetical protein